ncbi:S8 family serine peptidase [Microcella daejeonensis]|uniref:S8 family serine peptidase n=1 Tax=Microcella daejeonensis TaxID=2994971 RepID=A0A9E8SBS5_9MICO|nr:S8 family serine peptidase [Microcella daejeonensis]WAB81862.1 S8 family serine peptidase [Microcella daejeonensis]
MSTVVGLLAATLTVAPAPAAESAWIVETAPGAVEVVAAVAEDLGGEPVETFDDAFSGVAAELTDAEAGVLEQRPDVVAVHPDIEITLFDTQTSAPWHLSRLDQATAPADGTYSYPASAGSGVRVYVVDSGISPNPGQLGSRLLPGVSALAGDPSTADCQGHGTHVAGIVASTAYGVAKKASVVPVRVFSCSGSTSSSTVISGLNWIAANHPAGTPGIVNMSLGGPASSPLDSAVQNLITRGMIVTVAAGNGGADQIGDDACTESPARVPAALTVGATTTTDARAAYSNFGTCLDLFAPGSAVRSLYFADPSSSISMSGTSMASPVVAGVAALAWSESPGASARQVESRLVSTSRAGVASGRGAGSPDRLVAVTIAAPTDSAGALAIAAEHQRRGGSSGPLGAALSAPACAYSTTECWGDFTSGVIHWSSKTGVRVVGPELIVAYRAVGGPSGTVGPPVTDATAASGGVTQGFRQGVGYTSAAGSVIHRTGSAIHARYATGGGPTGGLGWPTSTEQCGGSRCAAEFEHGVISWMPATGVHEVGPDFIAAYRQAGGTAGALGLPIDVPRTYVAGISGTAQNFEGGYIYGSSAGTVPLRKNSGIFQRYSATGSQYGPLGWPTATEVCLGASCRADFVNGSIAWTPSTGVRVVAEPLRSAWDSIGGQSGVLGSPQGEQVAYFAGTAASGSAQDFLGGYVYSSSAGTVGLRKNSGIFQRYGASGSQYGPAGWPVTEEQCWEPTACAVAFERQTITWTPSAGVRVVAGALDGAYRAAGGARSPLGPATSDPFTDRSNGGGTAQAFTGGYGYQSAAGAAVLALDSVVFQEYARQGSQRGPLGWPLGSERCDDEGCVLVTQGGWITWARGASTATTVLTSTTGSNREG